jgi:hypothetical protein
VTISNSVKSIEIAAFMGCSSLKNVTIPCVTIIDSRAFMGCSSLKSVIIPCSVKRISGDAFRRCESLESIIIRGSVTSIRAEAFYGCNNLTSIIVSNRNQFDKVIKSLPRSLRGILTFPGYIPQVSFSFGSPYSNSQENNSFEGTHPSFKN